MQEILDVALAQTPEQARAQFGLLLAGREHGQAATTTSARVAVPDDVESLTAWITSTNTAGGIELDNLVQAPSATC